MGAGIENAVKGFERGREGPKRIFSTFLRIKKKKKKTKETEFEFFEFFFESLPRKEEPRVSERPFFRFRGRLRDGGEGS